MLTPAGSGVEELSTSPMPPAVPMEGRPSGVVVALGTKVTAALAEVVVLESAGLVALESSSSDKNCMTLSVRASLSLLRSWSVAQ